MIQLPTPDDKTLWVNPDFIVSVEGDSRGSLIRLIDGSCDIVALVPDSVVEAIRDYYA